MRAITVWLVSLCGLVAAMVVVGGLTRLTGSGLSIVEWAPFSGVIPPLSTERWLDALVRYRATPEGRLVHPGIELEQFRALFLVEWAHRLLARVVGLALIVPPILLRRAIDRAMARRLAVVLALAATQAFAGWWMVSSGLFDAPHVSPYRLVVHLLLAFAIFGVLLFTTLDHLGMRAVEVTPALARASRLLLALVAVTAATGGAMAGTRAGLLFATFPDMNGAWVPSGVFAGGARAALEDPLTAHFDHRLLALLLTAASLGFSAYAVRGPLRSRVYLLLFAIVLQLTLGVVTVMAHVPIAAAVAHQLGGLFVFGVTASLVHGARR